jgi:hypothetical protein
MAGQGSGASDPARPEGGVENPLARARLERVRDVGAVAARGAAAGLAHRAARKAGLAQT